MSDPEDEVPSDRSTRVRPETWRSERSLPPEDDREAPVNPEWRSGRINRSNAARRSGATNLFPASPQDIPTWLQAGGWRIVAAVAAVLVVLLVVLLLFRGSPTPLRTAQNPLPTSAAEAETGLSATNPLLQPTITSAPAPTAPPAAETVFVVAGTESQGLFLRSDHDTSSQVIETLPDGTRVQQVGEDFPGPDRVWRHVRGPSGKDGWVAVEFLTAAP